MRSFFSYFVCLETCVLLICMAISFLYDLVEDLVYAIGLGFFSLICAYNLKIWSFHGVQYFLDVAF